MMVEIPLTQLSAAWERVKAEDDSTMTPTETINELRDLARILQDRAMTFNSSPIGVYAFDWYTRKLSAIGYAIGTLSIEQAQRGGHVLTKGVAR